MRKVFALIRASWLHQLSYRLQMMFTVVGLAVGVFPLYLISQAIQPMMASSVQGEGGQYFAFLIVGLVTYAFIATASGALHATLASEISTGGLEALLSTPTPLPVLMAGMIGQAFTHTSFRAAILLIAAWVLGAKLVWSALLVSLGILALLIAAYTAIGVMAASLVLAFKSTGPLPGMILGLSALLGGVYYPTTSIPGWLQPFAQWVPLTYGLRPLRQTLLQGASIETIGADVAILAGFAAVLLGVSAVAFGTALNYAKKKGTLAQY